MSPQECALAGKIFNSTLTVDSHSLKDVFFNTETNLPGCSCDENCLITYFNSNPHPTRMSQIADKRGCICKKEGNIQTTIPQTISQNFWFVNYTLLTIHLICIIDSFRQRHQPLNNSHNGANVKCQSKVYFL